MIRDHLFLVCVGYDSTMSSSSGVSPAFCRIFILCGQDPHWFPILFFRRLWTICRANFRGFNSSVLRHRHGMTIDLRGTIGTMTMFFMASPIVQRFEHLEKRLGGGAPDGLGGHWLTEVSNSAKVKSAWLRKLDDGLKAR